MSTTLYAQPYDISVTGFYFTSAEDYQEKSDNLKNRYGDPVEEFEIQFIDGEGIDCELAKAMGLSQCNIELFFDWVDEWEDDKKIRFIIAVGECSYSFDKHTNPDDFDIDLYQESSMRDLAISFVEEGLFGDIPERFQFYIDYDAIARDLSVEYSETVIDGEDWIYRCG